MAKSREPQGCSCNGRKCGGMGCLTSTPKQTRSTGPDPCRAALAELVALRDAANRLIEKPAITSRKEGLDDLAEQDRIQAGFDAAWAAARSALAQEGQTVRMLTSREVLAITGEPNYTERVQQEFASVNGLTLASAPQPQDPKGQI